MQNRLSRAGSVRMRSDIEAAIEHLPGLASLALWCRFADTDAENEVAYTDGSTIYAGAEYEKREPKVRRFIILHEILHIALCHPQRFVELERRDVSFCPQLLNIAADAIINGSLDNLTAISAPGDAWTLAGIWNALERSASGESTVPPNAHAFYSFAASPRAKKIAGLTKSEFVRVNRWSCEELYYFLKAQKNSFADFYSVLVESYAKDSLSDDLRGVSDGESSPTENFSQQPLNGTMAAEERQNWRGRLSLLRGNLPALFDRLTGEIMHSETPWERILREIVQTVFQESVVTDHSRPSRRWLTLERNYQAVAGVALPFAPDVRRKRGARLVVALDTSGSIDDELLGRFLTEIVALCELNQRNLILIIGDAKVHSVAEIEWREASEQLREIKYTGGGGTDFRPLIAEAAKHEPDALIYLTDFSGETGDQPTFPVIWACIPAASAPTPWGEQIKLK